MPTPSGIGGCLWESSRASFPMEEAGNYQAPETKPPNLFRGGSGKKIDRIPKNFSAEPGYSTPHASFFLTRVGGM